MNLPTADLVDRFEPQLKSCPVQFKDYGGRIRFSGRVRTLSCREDNALIKQTLSERVHVASVLVIDGGGSLQAALVGDVLAALGAGNGWSGLVINGAIRDVTGLKRLDIGVKALGANPMRSAKLARGAVDEPVTIGGVVFHLGDWLYADEDGVILSSTELSETAP